MTAARQFSADDRCTECRRKLSRYNPFTVCGPCRVALTPTLPSKQFAIISTHDDEAFKVALERFPTRPQVNPPEVVSTK